MKAKRVVTVLLPAVSGLSRNLVRGIADYAEQQGDWHLVLELYGMVQDENFRAIQKGDGILTESILPTSPLPSPRWKIPLVGMQNQRLLKHGPVVSSDNVAMGRMAGEYFVEKGMTHLAYVSYAEGNQSEQGLRQVAAEKNLELKSYYLGNEKPHLDPTARRRLWQWFENLPAPTGILFRDDQLAHKLMNLLPREWVPERLALLGIGDDPLVCDLCRPRLSSMARDGRSIGRKAAELLHRLMDGEDLPFTTHLMPPGQIVERASTGIDYTPDPLVTKAVRWINDHLAEATTVEEICRAVRTPRRSLERRFTETLGRTVWQERRHRQIRKAKELLRHTDKPLGWISDACGFGSPQQFSRTFTQEVGTNPRRYRRG